MLLLLLLLPDASVGMCLVSSMRSPVRHLAGQPGPKTSGLHSIQCVIGKLGLPKYVRVPAG